jgi:hypothetical protein
MLQGPNEDKDKQEPEQAPEPPVEDQFPSRNTETHPDTFTEGEDPDDLRK